MSATITTVSRATQPQLGSAASSMAIVRALALFHLYFNNRSGYFRDEFDCLACGDRLARGYVDQPPLIPFLAHISRALVGDSLRAIRFLPTLNGRLGDLWPKLKRWG